MQLLLIRHARPRRVELAEGAADPGLDDEGRRQARALAEWLASEAIDAVYSSPLTRARKTAAPLAARLGLAVVVAEGVAEFDRAASAYIPIEEMRAERDPRLQALYDGDWTEWGGEDPAALRSRTVAAIDAIVAAHPAQTVAVVCHGGVINAYLGHVIGTANPLFFEPAYSSTSRVLASSRGHRQVVTLNEHAHLHPRA